jgi:hypothetical protein
MKHEVFKPASQEISATPALNRGPPATASPLAYTASDTKSLSEWTSAVCIRIGYGPIERVESAEEALSYLDHRWPRVDGQCRELALRTCIMAVGDSAISQEARDAFIAAATEARMLA